MHLAKRATRFGVLAAPLVRKWRARGLGVLEANAHRGGEGGIGHGCGAATTTHPGPTPQANHDRVQNRGLPPSPKPETHPLHPTRHRPPARRPSRMACSPRRRQPRAARRRPPHALFFIPLLLLALTFSLLPPRLDAFAPLPARPSPPTPATRLYAATLTRTGPRTRRRNLPVNTPTPEVPDDEVEDEQGGGGGGKKWVRVYPIGLGKYGDRDAVFLARRKEVAEDIRLETLPVPLFSSGDVEMLRCAFSSKGTSSSNKAAVLWAARHLAVKDAGLLDNVPWEWVETGQGEAAEAKKAAYNACCFGKGVEGKEGGVFFASPYGLLLDVVGRRLSASVQELLIDEEDSPRGPGITFGPLVVLHETTMQADAGAGAGGGGEQGRGKLVDCLLDEVVGLALELDSPIKMPEDLYEGTAVPTQALQRGADGVLSLVAEKDRDNEGRVRDLMRLMESVKPAWEIGSAAEFGRLDAQAKRLCLIKSGAEDIPKRRQGPLELDLALLPFLDETVRREARIALATARGDWATVEKLQAEKSERGKVKDRLRQAKEEGDEALVAVLEEEYVRLTVAKIDPTQDEGSYQKDLDQDDWYLKNRRL